MVSAVEDIPVDCAKKAGRALQFTRFMTVHPNPQGKGLTPVLESLRSFEPAILLPPKHVRQVRSELFTSLFILSSAFKFKPVAGKSYWLYRRAGAFSLSPLSPAHWSTGPPGDLVGECVLHEDLTWTLSLDERAAADAALLALIEEKQKQLDEALQSAETLEEALPAYDPSLRFYSRVLAHGLSTSLGISMRLSGIHALSYEQALGLLEDRSSG
jgi:hypothetical protein